MCHQSFPPVFWSKLWKKTNPLLSDSEIRFFKKFWWHLLPWNISTFPIGQNKWLHDSDQKINSFIHKQNSDRNFYRISKSWCICHLRLPPVFWSKFLKNTGVLWIFDRFFEKFWWHLHWNLSTFPIGKN